MSTTRPQALPTTPPSSPTLRQRVLRMVTAWACLGAVMGMSLGMESGGPIGAIAGTVAGAIEMAAFGAIFGLIGGSPEETLLGATCGIAVGLVAWLASGRTSLVFAADLGLVAGAVTGATLRPYAHLVSLPMVLVWRRARLSVAQHQPGSEPTSPAGNRERFTLE